MPPTTNVFNQRFEEVFEPPRPLQNLNLRRNAKPSTSKEDLRAGLLFTQHFWDLILANRRLRRLCLLHKASLQWTVKSSKFIYDLLRGMKELKELCALNIVDLTLFWKLQELAPTVEIVVTNKDMFPKVHDSTASEDGFNAQLIRANPFIKSLKFIRFPFSPLNRFRKPNGHPSIANVLVVLSQLPNLEYLNLTGIENHGGKVQESPPGLGLTVIPATLTSLEQGSTLTRLDIDDTRNLVPLLRYLPNLKALKVASLSDEAFEVLASSCKILESLEWMHS
ncbi:hypothetical protein BGZ65_011776, partial [Modicella reniformis]